MMQSVWCNQRDAVSHGTAQCSDATDGPYLQGPLVQGCSPLGRSQLLLHHHLQGMLQQLGGGRSEEGRVEGMREGGGRGKGKKGRGYGEKVGRKLGCNKGGECKARRSRRIVQ